MAKTEALTRQQIELSIKKKEFFPIYVLSGEEPFYVDKLSEMIIDNALTEEEKDFNLSVYYASDTRMADVALACRRYPMMAERQVVVLREAQAWKSMNGVNEKKELEILESYAEKPTASTVLVVCYKGATLKSPNLTKILAKTMPDGRKAGIYFESKKIPEYSIGSNISEYVRSVGCTIDDKALAMLTAPAAAAVEEEEPAPPEPEPYDIYDPTVMPEGGVRDGVTYAAYDGIVEHLFFHPVIAYPELAFDGDAQANGLDDYMVTVDEYNKILQSVYDKGYVLVDIADVWSEVTGEDGQPKMVKNTLYLPEGKKPLILSYDDTNYYDYMLANGFAYKLIIGEDGKIASWGLDPQGNEVVSRDLDAIPILDKFVEEHPDFSPFGAKGCLSLTGYQGILGYRTQTDTQSWTDAQEANRQKEIEAVKPIVAELKRTGWTFGSHTWGHIRLGTKSLESIQADTERWLDEVGSLVGPTTILFYPHGERPDGNDWQNTGPVFRYLQSQGFRVFASVGIESFSFIKKDVCAVICDRLHPDGTTLRHSRDRYLQFYDAKDIMDVSVRPQREISWA